MGSIERTTADVTTSYPLRKPQRRWRRGGSDPTLSLHRQLQLVGFERWPKDHSSWYVPPAIQIDLPLTALGAPRLWSENPLPIQIAPDIGERFIDQNGSRMKGRPLIPLVKAVEKVTAGRFAWGDVDFVTDRNNLRKLWRWSNGSESVSKRGPFRIDTQLVGKTILFKRVDRAVTERMSGYTFGFNFEEKFTVPAQGCEGTTGHHRIINYVSGKPIHQLHIFLRPLSRT